LIGKTLGNYEIIKPLGAGGMGEVYRAHDANLKRDVAIKVLPQELSTDPDRLARLEREAHLLASLNHPNIATIFSLEEVDDTRFLVLELIDGESLQQRLERGPLPVAEALDVCAQIARALEVAHAEGIVHRDLKPANVLITPDDRVKVLDFGIAKSLRPVGEGDDTVQATELTMAGTLVGTAPYMSPEQVRGEAVDKRSDIWAFGCVFFEVLSGKGPFGRETIADTLAAIVGEEPNWESLPAEASPAVRMLLHRCLQKSPKVRQRDIGDAWVEISQSLSHPGGVAMSLPPTIAGADSPGLRVGIAAWLVIAALSIGAVTGWWLGPEAPAPGKPLYFDVELPPGGFFPPGSGSDIAISPDGNTIAFVAEGPFGRQLFVQRLDEPGDPVPVEGTEDAGYPFFSPDGVSLAFDKNGDIVAISLVGGNSEVLCTQCRHGAWGDDNSIIVQATADSADSPWARIPEPGAKSMEMLPSLSLDGVPLQPDRVDVLPGSRAVLFEDGGAIYASSFDTQVVVEVTKNATDPYYAGGYVLFPRDQTLYALPFDAATLSVTGTPIMAKLDVKTEPAGALHAAVSRNNGVLAFAPVRTETPGFRLGWVDRMGGWESIAADDGHIGITPRVSPDGRRILLGMAPEPAGIYLVDDRTKALDPFHIVDKVKISSINHALWSRDGTAITYRETRLNESEDEPFREFAIVRKLVGGSGAAETLIDFPFATTHSLSPARNQ